MRERECPRCDKNFIPNKDKRYCDDCFDQLAELSFDLVENEE